MPNPIPQEQIQISEVVLKKLEKASTATIATLLFKRGYINAYIQGVSPITKNTVMVGPAYTLRHIPARPDTDPLTAFREADHPQRMAIENCPQGSVLVMDCRQDTLAASAGSILLTRLEVRGAAGLVSDGGIRDVTGASQLSMPVFAAKASAPTNLTRHHALETNVPIGCGGVAVYPGDILVGDDDGVMVIPRHLAEEVSNECEEMELFEEFVLQQVLNGESIIGLYPPTREEHLASFEKWRVARTC